jgi:hypothetical protein
MDMAEVHLRPIVRGESPLLDLLMDATEQTTGQTVDGPLPLRSPTVESILTWRQHLASKYHDQLGEALTWDEGSIFETSGDVTTGGDLIFRYVAAVLDQRGQAELGSISGGRRPPLDQLDAAFTEADRRGFGGHFPHLLLGAYSWLPFERNLMIEEPRWDGKMARYGSVFRLVDKISTVRAAIAVADPAATSFSESDDDAPEYSLAAAWQTSATILRLATVATTRHLPLWTTG